MFVRGGFGARSRSMTGAVVAGVIGAVLWSGIGSGTAAATPLAPTPSQPAAAQARAEPTPATRTAERRRLAAIERGLTHRSATQLYLVPHQDDETLAMGGAIVSDVAAGRDVILVLVTKGNNVRANRLVNQSLAAEGRPPITQTEFQEGRKREFVAAARALGVPSRNLRFLAVTDDVTDKARMEAVVDRLVAQHGNRVGYNAMSWLDANPTHYAMADRLDAKCRTDVLKECHFYQLNAYQTMAPKYAQTSPVVTPVGKWMPDRGGRVLKAAEEYRRWDPARGRYAIGWRHSIPRAFTALMAKPGSWTHGPSKRDQWVSPADRTAALAWIRTTQRSPDPALATLR